MKLSFNKITKIFDDGRNKGRRRSKKAAKLSFIRFSITKHAESFFFFEKTARADDISKGISLKPFNVKSSTKFPFVICLFTTPPNRACVVACTIDLRLAFIFSPLTFNVHPFCNIYFEKAWRARALPLGISESIVFKRLSLFEGK